ncbi:MAG: cell division protein FtsZ [Luteolibacter sp.]
MISYSRDPQETIPTSAVKIVGLGGAGANMLERIALDGLDGAELLALNTDIRTLHACLAQEKIQLGLNLTKGLGAGGDPELGHQAVLEAENEIRAALKGRRIVFLCTGLGGGTGSGAAPIVTRIAREEGAFVVVFATMPFAFEGRRRREQAETSLNELAVLSNALVTFDNNRMGELVLAKQGIHEAFAAADSMICESIKAVIRLVARPGLINVGLDDLMSALRTTRSRCLFGSGIANGKDRASRALKNALGSPLLDQGALLKDAQTVLVHLCGGEDLTLFEIELLMQRLQKYVPEKAHVLFGAAIDPLMKDSLSITLISALPEDALVSAPRDAISRPLDTQELDPSDGFTQVKAVVAPVLETKVEVSAEEDASSFPPPLPDFAPAPEPEEIAFKLPEAEKIEAPEEETVTEEIPAPTAVEPEEEVQAGETEEVDSEEEPAVEEKEEEKPEAPEIEERPFAEPVFVLPVEKKSPQTPAREPDGFPFDLDEPDAPAVENPKEEKPGSDSEEAPAPKLKLGVKTPISQSELFFDSAPRGRFEGENPNVFEGEDLDLPPFLRKKRS